MVIQSLKSKYLVGVLDICDVDETTSCLIMELCDGDLENHLKYNAPHGCLTTANLRFVMAFVNLNVPRFPETLLLPLASLDDFLLLLIITLSSSDYSNVLSLSNHNAIRMSSS